MAIQHLLWIFINAPTKLFVYSYLSNFKIWITENSNISKENVKNLYLFATSNIQETWCYPDVGYENVFDNRERSTTDIPNFCGCITTNHLQYWSNNGLVAMYK
jgi:hypothetical protein